MKKIFNKKIIFFVTCFFFLYFLNAIELRWGEVPAANISGYKIYYKTNYEDSFVLLTNLPNNKITNITLDSSLFVTNRLYYFTIRSYRTFSDLTVPIILESPNSTVITWTNGHPEMPYLDWLFFF